jgi:hypothetical protein
LVRALGQAKAEGVEDDGGGEASARLELRRRPRRQLGQLRRRQRQLGGDENLSKLRFGIILKNPCDVTVIINQGGHMVVRQSAERQFDK